MEDIRMEFTEKIKASRPRNGKQFAELFEAYLKNTFGMKKGAYFFNRKVAARKFGVIWDHFRIEDVVRALAYYKVWGDLMGTKHGEGVRPYPSHEHFLKHIRALVSFAATYDADPEGVREKILSEKYGLPASVRTASTPRPGPTLVPSETPKVESVELPK